MSDYCFVPAFKSTGAENRPQTYAVRFERIRSIEQDADLVVFLYRDEYYNEDTEVPGECIIWQAEKRPGQEP